MPQSEKSTTLPSCQIEIRVRYVETDRAGYLHHSCYLVYFEMGRTELLRQMGVTYDECEQRGIFYVVSRIECKFLAPARYDDVLTLTTRVVRTGRARIDHEYELTRDGQMLCRAWSTLACVDRTGRPQANPDFILPAS